MAMPTASPIPPQAAAHLPLHATGNMPPTVAPNTAPVAGDDLGLLSLVSALGAETVIKTATLLANDTDGDLLKVTGILAKSGIKDTLLHGSTVWAH